MKVPLLDLKPQYRALKPEIDAAILRVCESQYFILGPEVKALEALMKTGGGKLPINVKVLFEGEEEVGGESIAEYIRKQKGKLKADFALVCDTELFAPDLPTLCVGLRGLVYTEIEAYGSKTDLHSGMYGGAAPNPFFALIEMIGKMR